ncbi:MAG TPA: hypothetical protein ENK23_07475, partial [Sorangium sp.]|nr:hypothetical protein [Sorangium sp.]
MSQARTPQHRRPAMALAAAAALVAALVGGGDTPGASSAGRDEALAIALAKRGLIADARSVVWLDVPPFGVVRAASQSALAFLRAVPGEQEPHDIYLVTAKLSPEGVLLRTGKAFNLTETSAVDELAPVAGAGWVAFSERNMLGDEPPRTVRLLKLSGEAAGDDEEQWSRLERVQAGLTRLQQTGRVAGLARVTYELQTAPKQLLLQVQDGKLLVKADGEQVVIDPLQPLSVPDSMTVEVPPARRPGNLITWSVDRVRSVVGSEAMQYVKAIAYTAKDAIRAEQEDVTDNTGADSIAEDLGQETLEPATREIPVDPEIGFPPPPLTPWLKRVLPGEGKWNAKSDDPFIHTLPGLPPTFVTTFIRGDRRRQATRGYIALWDPRLVQLNMMAG